MTLRHIFEASIEVLLFVFAISVVLVFTACIVLSGFGFEIHVKTFIEILPSIPDWMFRPVLFLALAILLSPASEILACGAVIAYRRLRKGGAQ